MRTRYDSQRPHSGRLVARCQAPEPLRFRLPQYARRSDERIQSRIYRCLSERASLDPNAKASTRGCMLRFLISCCVVLALVGVAIAQANSQTKLQFSPEQAEVWQGELNFYRYLKAKDLKGFMSL